MEAETTREGTAQPVGRPVMRPGLAPLVAGAYIALAFALVIAVDLLHLVQWEDRLQEVSGQPLLWYTLFHAWGPTQILLWTGLLALAFVAGSLSFRHRRDAEVHAARFWLLIALAAVLLALEDALTLRHHIAAEIMALMNLQGRHFVRTGTETFYYIAIASLPLFALVNYGSVPAYRPGRKLLLTGYILYAATVAGGLTGAIGGWYAKTGTWINGLTGGRLGAGFLAPRPDRPVGYWITGHMIETSIALIAVALLLAGAIAYARNERDPEIGPAPEDEDDRAPDTSDAPDTHETPGTPDTATTDAPAQDPPPTATPKSPKTPDAPDATDPYEHIGGAE